VVDHRHILGIFAVVIPDNMSAIVDTADAVAPRFNAAFLEYAQSRGFVIDPARVRSPKDKPKVERQVQYVRGSYFAGEDIVDLADAQRRATTWCATTAGLRTHGTTQWRPLEVFRLEEAPLLAPAPSERYDLPLYATPKVHRDHHIEVDKALYSVPGNLIGFRVNARADALLVKVFHRGQLIKVHPRQRQGGRHSDACDLPTGTEVYAMRDIEALKAMAAVHGRSVGAYATALLDSPLPWTRMRQVYRLLGLAKKWGATRVEAACGRALEAEAVDVGLIARMLERATENAPPAESASTVSNVIPGRFSRDASDFATATLLPRPRDHLGPPESRSPTMILAGSGGVKNVVAPSMRERVRAACSATNDQDRLRRFGVSASSGSRRAPTTGFCRRR